MMIRSYVNLESEPISFAHRLLVDSRKPALWFKFTPCDFSKSIHQAQYMIYASSFQTWPYFHIPSLSIYPCQFNVNLFKIYWILSTQTWVYIVRHSKRANDDTWQYSVIGHLYSLKLYFRNTSFMGNIPSDSYTCANKDPYPTRCPGTMPHTRPPYRSI